MEEPSRTCPAGGTVLIGVSSPADPVDGSLYMDVTCTTCGHVGTDNIRARVYGFADWHLTDGWRKPGVDPEPPTPTPEERATANAEVERQHQPGGAYGPLTATEEAVAHRALDRIGRHRQFTNALGEALQDVWDDHVGDTRTVPDFLTLTVEDGEPSATANFRRGNYVSRVAEHVLDRIDPAGTLTRTDLDELAVYAAHEADMLEAPDHRNPDDQPTDDHAEAARLRALAARARRHFGP